MSTETKAFGGLVKSNLYTAWVHTDKKCHRFELDNSHFPCGQGDLVLHRCKSDGILCAGIVVRGSSKQSDIVIIETKDNQTYEGKLAGDLYALQVENHAFVDLEALSEKKRQAVTQWLTERRNKFSHQIESHTANAATLAREEAAATLLLEQQRLQEKGVKQRAYRARQKERRLAAKMREQELLQAAMIQTTTNLDQEEEEELAVMQYATRNNNVKRQRNA